METINDLHFVPSSPGIISCIAENKIGRSIARAHVLIRDIDDNMTITGISDKDVIARGDQVTITCAAVAYYFTSDLRWYKDGQPVQERNGTIYIIHRMLLFQFNI